VEGFSFVFNLFTIIIIVIIITIPDLFIVTITITITILFIVIPKLFVKLIIDFAFIHFFLLSALSAGLLPFNTTLFNLKILFIFIPSFIMVAIMNLKSLITYEYFNWL
jgi:hypothetical protein